MVCLIPATLISDFLLGTSSGSPQQEMRGWEERGGSKSSQNPTHMCPIGVSKGPWLPAPLFLTSTCTQPTPRPLSFSGREETGTPALLYPLLGADPFPVFRAEPTLCLGQALRRHSAQAGMGRVGKWRHAQEKKGAKENIGPLRNSRC